jgi:hypothetical protein
MAACDARRRLADHQSTAPLPDHVKLRRHRRGKRLTGHWTGSYYLDLANLLKEQIKVMSLLSSEFAVRKAYPELLFSVSLFGEGDTRLPLALLRVLCELTGTTVDAGVDGTTGDGESARNAQQQNRLRVVAHKLFYDLFVSEERVLRSTTSAKTTTMQALSQDPPAHYLNFALMAKRSVDFWGQRKEQALSQRREEKIKLRKRKDVLATRTTEAGGDLEGTTF